MMRARSWWLGVAVGIVGCGATAPPVDDGAASVELASDPQPLSASWPGRLLVSEGSGPALFLDQRPAAPAIGYVSEGVIVRVMGEPEGDRIPVRVDGPLKVRGWLKTDRLAARAQRRSRVAGTPTYLGPNDIVTLRGPGSAPGMVRVEVSPWLGLPSSPQIGPFVGEVPADLLGAEILDATAAEGPTAGVAMQGPPGVVVSVYDRIGGEVVATIPALSPPLRMVVLREQDEWRGVRIGVGPYLIGYVNLPLTPASGPPESVTTPPEPDAPLPVRIAREAQRPLHRIKEGARVRFDGQTIAILAAPGHAREMHRYPGTSEVDVFVAVDDDVAVRGMVRAEDLEPSTIVAPPATRAPSAPSVPRATTDEFED